MFPFGTVFSRLREHFNSFEGIRCRLFLLDSECMHEELESIMWCNFQMSLQTTTHIPVHSSSHLILYKMRNSSQTLIIYYEQAWCVTMERLHTLNEYRRAITLVWQRHSRILYIAYIHTKTSHHIKAWIPFNFYPR